MTLVSVNFCGGEVLSIYRQVVILRNFPLIVESNLENLGFALLRPVVSHKTHAILSTNQMPKNQTHLRHSPFTAL